MIPFKFGIRGVQLPSDKLIRVQGKEAGREWVISEPKEPKHPLTSRKS